MRHLNSLLLSLLVLLTGCDAISPFVGEDLKIAICDRDGDGLPRSSEYCGGSDCDDGDQNVGEPMDWFRDVDIDSFGAGEAVPACTQPEGYVDHNGDCDDTDQLVNPDGTETCNGYDDNCDGNVDDENINVWYADVDEDSYGDPAVSLEQCAEPEGYVDNALDCDDANDTVSPDGTEVCDDGIDQDCNNIVDDAAGSQAWYADVDGDGWGDEDTFLYSCTESVEEHVLDNTDCDDTSYDVSPAASEACGDGVDNDCDGEIDTDAENVPWYRDADEDGYGDEADTTTDCAPPDGYVGNAGDCNDANTSINPGVEEVCNNGADDNCDDSPNTCLWSGTVSASDADTTLTGEHDGDLVSTSSVTCDLNDDGVLDLITGGYANSTSGSDADVVWVVFGPITGDANLSTADVIIQSLETGSSFSVACGDLSGDGADDLVLGASRDDGAAADSGMVYLFNGPLAGGTTSTSDADVAILGETAGEYFGLKALVIDFDLDGQEDLAVSAQATSSQQGSVRLFTGPITVDLLASNANTTILGEGEGDQAGYTLVAGDVDGDGLDDLLVGAPFNDENGSGAGATYVLYSPINMGLTTLSDADLLCYGETEDDQFGSALGSGDVDGDGAPDLLVGASQESSAGANAGAVYLLLAPMGTCDLPSALKLTGGAASEYAGTSLGVGDVDQDGSIDLIVGAVTGSNGGLTQNGSAYLIYGPISGSGSLGSADALFGGSADYDQTGWLTQINEDLSGDGWPDAIVSSINNDDAGNNAGAVYIFEGLGY